MSRDLGNNSDGDACENSSADAEASLSDTRCLTSAQVGNHWYGRSPSKVSRTWSWSGACWRQWHGHSGRGFGFNTGWGRDWSRHSNCSDNRPTRQQHWRVPIARAGIRQPWRFGEQLMVEVPRPGYADYGGRTTEQAVTLHITIERTD